MLREEIIQALQEVFGNMERITFRDTTAVAGSAHLVPKRKTYARGEERFPREQEKALRAREQRQFCVFYVRAPIDGFLLTGFIIALASREILPASAVKVLIRCHTFNPRWHPFHIKPY